MTTPQSPAKVEVDRLLELPKPSVCAFSDISESFLRENHYTADQMRAYATQHATEAIAAERAEVVRLMEAADKLLAAISLEGVALTTEELETSILAKCAATEGLHMALGEARATITQSGGKGDAS